MRLLTRPEPLQALKFILPQGGSEDCILRGQVRQQIACISGYSCACYHTSLALGMAVLHASMLRIMQQDKFWPSLMRASASTHQVENRKPCISRPCPRPAIFSCGSLLPHNFAATHPPFPLHRWRRLAW